MYISHPFYISNPVSKSSTEEFINMIKPEIGCLTSFETDNDPGYAIEEVRNNFHTYSCATV